MIHDFATAPRTPRMVARPIATTEKHSVPKVNGRILAILLFVLVVVSLWSIASKHSLDQQSYVPDADAKEEYLQAASTEEVLLQGPHSFKTEQDEANSADLVKKQALETAITNHVGADDGFGFYDSLQASQWDVPVQRGIYLTAEDRKRASYRYILQAASVRDRAEAAALVGRLNKLGLTASYSASSSGYEGSAWYRVNVGPFSNVSVMNKAEDVLVSMHMMPLKRRIQ